MDLVERAQANLRMAVVGVTGRFLSRCRTAEMSQCRPISRLLFLPGMNDRFRGWRRRQRTTGFKAQSSRRTFVSQCRLPPCSAPKRTVTADVHNESLPHATSSRRPALGRAARADPVDGRGGGVRAGSHWGRRRGTKTPHLAAEPRHIPHHLQHVAPHPRSPPALRKKGAGILPEKYRYFRFGWPRKGLIAGLVGDSVPG